MTSWQVGRTTNHTCQVVAVLRYLPTLRADFNYPTLAMEEGFRRWAQYDNG
jgi:hypothetical protein